MITNFIAPQAYIIPLEPEQMTSEERAEQLLDIQDQIDYKDRLVLWWGRSSKQPPRHLQSDLKCLQEELADLNRYGEGKKERRQAAQFVRKPKN